MSERYNTYVGARYVPIFDGDWDNTKPYEPLTIVMYQGDSYTSKTYVPSGALISNETYWAKTGNYNAQVQQLYEEVVADHARVDQCENDVADLTEAISGYDAQFSTINEHLGAHDTAITNLNQRITNEVATLNETITTDVAGVQSNLDTEVGRIDGEISDINEAIEELQGAGGFTSPEAFGAVGDGTTDDTQALQDCFIYASEHNVPIVGSKTYRVVRPNNSADYCVVSDYGVTCYNLNLVVTDTYSDNLCIIACRMDDKPYTFVNCKFVMPTMTSSITTDKSALEFVPRTGGNSEWINNIGNVSIINCYFNNMRTAIKCNYYTQNKFFIKGCTLNNLSNCGVHWLGARVYAEDCTYTIAVSTNYKGFIYSPCGYLTTTEANKDKRSAYISNCYGDYDVLHIEPETNNKLGIIDIKSCGYNTDSSDNSGVTIYKENKLPNFERITIDNCNFGGGSRIDVYNAIEGTITITNSTLRYLTGWLVGNTCIFDNDIVHRLRLGGINTSTIIISNTVFDGYGSEPCLTTYTAYPSEPKIKRLILNNIECQCGPSGGSLEVPFINDFGTDEIFINGLTFYKEYDTTEFIDNSGISNNVSTKVYAQSVKSLVDRASGKYFAKGVDTLIIDCIATSGAITTSSVTNTKINRIYL